MRNIKIILFFISLLYAHSSSATGLTLPIQYPITDSPLSISITPNADNIVLGQQLTIRCHVNTNSKKGDLMSKISMTLYCPVTSSDKFCFQNCMPQTQCTNMGTKRCQRIRALNNVSCRTIKQSDGVVLHEYVVEQITPDWLDLGESNYGFACASAGEQTQWIQLKQRKRTTRNPMTTTTAVLKPISKIPASTKSTMTTTTTTTRKMSTQPLNQVVILPHPDFHRANSINKEILTPEKILVIIIIGLLLSVLINVFWCIRCVLIKQYSKSVGGVPMKSLFCMKKEVSVGRMIQQAKTQQSYLLTQPHQGYIQTTGIPMLTQHGFIKTAPTNDTSPSNESWIYDAAICRSHPEGKATNSTLSNSGGRNSDSGVSLAQPPVQLFTATGQPVLLTSGGWSSAGSVTPSMVMHKQGHHMQHNPFYQPKNRQSQVYSSQMTPSYSEYYDHNGKGEMLIKRVPSRETLLSGIVIQSQMQSCVLPNIIGSASEKAVSEINSQKPVRTTSGAGFYPPKYYIPVVMDRSDVIGASRSHLPYGSIPQIWPQHHQNPQQPPSLTSQPEESSSSPGAGSPRMRVILPATTINQYQSGQSAERSKLVLVKADQFEQKTLTKKNGKEMDGNMIQPTQVQNWLQNCETPEIANSPRMLNKAAYRSQPGERNVADSLNTEDDAPSDWSEMASKNVS